MEVEGASGAAGSLRAESAAPSPQRERIMVIKGKNYHFSYLDESDARVAKKLDEVLDIPEARKPQALADVILTVAQLLTGIEDLIHNVQIEAQDARGRYKVKIVYAEDE